MGILHRWNSQNEGDRCVISKPHNNIFGLNRLALVRNRSARGNTSACGAVWGGRENGLF
jgi:hypothetical protein